MPWRFGFGRTPKDQDVPGKASVTPRVWISSIRFSDGSESEFGRDDVVVIVGPNNAGKSATLRGISAKLEDASKQSPVIAGLAFAKTGSSEDVATWLSDVTRLVRISYGEYFQLFENSVSRNAVGRSWEDGKELGQLTGFFCTFLNAEGRLKAANPPESIAVTSEGLKHPIHVLQWDDSVERRISDHFEKAFGTALVVHRHAGKIVPILVGKVPQLEPGMDRHSIEYVLKLEKLPPIHLQGDGMRSFLGVLLYAAVGCGSMLLIDEPEAFLHPPQARHLGSFLVSEAEENKQLFIATHSGDVLRGVLDSESTRVRVLRIRRDGDTNRALVLDNAEVTRLWSDPLLRYSSILDGLFHDRVVLCESDSDCRFYSAVADSIFESPGNTERKPDVMFTHCGGKDRLALIIRSLRSLGVPVSTVADFDILSSELPLRDIVEAAGGDWRLFKPDWKVLKDAIDSKKPELSIGEVRDAIDAAFASVKGHTLPDSAKKSIQEALRASSPWATAKSAGVAYVPNGDASETAKRLLRALQGLGIYVVPVGELERFVKTAPGHGPSWVANALKKDLKSDPEFEAAKQFVRNLLAG